MLKEFREFIAKGNVLDLAVGIIIGAAFTAIVNSFVKDIINPVIGLAGKANFDYLYLTLRAGKGGGPYKSLADAEADSAVVLKYGSFLTNVLNFLIVAFVVFLVVKAANAARKRMEKPAEQPKPGPSRTEVLLEEIRDALVTRP